MQGSGLQAARDLRDVRARLLLGGTGPGARGGGGGRGGADDSSGWSLAILAAVLGTKLYGLYLCGVFETLPKAIAS